jgi:hypothetical protein
MKLRYLKYFTVAGLLSLFPASLWAQSTQELLGLSYLAQSQNSDGSWGGTASSIDDVFPSTSTAVDALKLIEITPSANRTNAIGYLSAQSIDVTDYLSRRIVSLSGTDTNTSADLVTLLALKNIDNGWGGAAGFSSEVLDAALTLRALASAGSANTVAITGAVRYLLSAQNTDGGLGLCGGGWEPCVLHRHRDAGVGDAGTKHNHHQFAFASDDLFARSADFGWFLDECAGYGLGVYGDFQDDGERGRAVCGDSVFIDPTTDERIME